MSVKNAQKQSNQPLGKKRKSCFEITRVAFQNLSEEDTDGDEDADVESIKEVNFCGDCENYFPIENFKDSQDDISSRTRFKVLKAAYIRGRWNCNDSLETVKGKVLPTNNEFGCCKISKFSENEQLLHSSLNVLSHPDGKTSICSETLVVESTHTIPDLLGHKVHNISEDVHLHFNLNNELSFQSHHELTRNIGSLERSSSTPSFDKIVEPDVTYTCRKAVDQSVECLLVGDHHVKIQTLQNGHAEENHDKIPYQKGSLALLNSSENISEKISKALDLAKEHVILTAHGEIERLKDKILELQSTIKRLEEENMQLRGMNVQNQLDITSTVATEDLIDLSDD